MVLAWLAFFDSLVAISAVIAGVIAAHFGLTTPFFGFSLVVGGTLFAVLALIFSALALLVMLSSPARRRDRPRAVVGGIIALIVLVPPVAIVMTHPYPAINDITTDTQNPPEFVHAQELPGNRGRDMKYDPATAKVQEIAVVYRDLQPLKLDLPLDDAFKKAQVIAGEVTDWQITSNDSKTRTIEGVATSALFRFKDDFVIQIRPADGGGTLVEMRSRSREGKGDFGSNYNRIQSFFHLMEGPPRGGTQAN
jgi:uncharacterized protein (DUF1499 family)